MINKDCGDRIDDDGDTGRRQRKDVYGELSTVVDTYSDVDR